MENPPLFLLSMAELNSSQAGIYGCEVVSQYSALEAVDRVNVQVIIKSKQLAVNINYNYMTVVWHNIKELVY